MMQTGWYYKDVFQAIANTEAMPPSIQASVYAVITYGFNKKAVLSALSEYGAADITYYKNDWLDLLLSYANIILDDHAISEQEFNDFGLLKLLFKVKEGDFHTLRFHQIKEIVNQQMEALTEDGKITLDETLTTANIQGMFDLSSEQFFALWDKATPTVKRTDNLH